MRKSFVVSALLFFVFSFAQFAHAVTVYYQPTPYPLKKADGTAMPQDVNIVHVWDGWLPSYYYGQTFQRDSKLQIGGWGDQYRTFVKLDLTGLPQSVDLAYLWLMPYARGDSSTPIPYAVCPATSSWNLSMTWSTQPSYGTCYGYWYSAPTANNWAGFWLSGGGINWYNQWKANTLVNNGVMLFPQATNNNFDVFYSTLYNDYLNDPWADGRRPVLQLNFTPPAGMPNFKMPVPGVLGPLKLTWLLTNEVGGYECTGGLPWPDTAHQGDNYFALDITWDNKDGNGMASQYGQYNTPVLAVAGGTVVPNGVGGNDINDSRGYYITLDHGNGYQTRYLHLQQPAARKNGTLLVSGNVVNQGDQIGIMGQTGKYWDAQTQSWKPSATGVHLHINFWINGTGPSTSSLAYAVMEGLLLKSYQTECTVNANGVPPTSGWIRYYNSTNTPTGN
jgi:murein DD-endopeptidase MepM/ murein hydrolase activator NlpD